MVKDYNYRILYHLRKANVVANTLSLKMAITPIRDLCLRITIISPLLDMIIQAQTEWIKEENQKKEKIRGQIATFITDRRGLLNQCGTIWVPFYEGGTSLSSRFTLA